ncbi:MAG TPA: PspC domain-containing protein [Bacteroidota bacterium]|nr:PspC domain-containing protein [Bacteroidota bacterium]
MTTTEHTGKRLYKSRQNKVIDGICGGIAEYFGVDPTIVRILWVLITLLGGSGLILYIIAMIIMPVNPQHVMPGASAETAAAAGAFGVPSDRKRNWGIVLILLGVFIMMTNLGWFADINWWHFSRTVVFPVSLILIGLLFIYVQTRKAQATVPPMSSAAAMDASMDPSATVPPMQPQGVKELRRSIADKKICGVCGGLASYFNIDSTLVRILFVVLILASVGWGLLLYIIMCILVPEERLTTSTTPL